MQPPKHNVKKTIEQFMDEYSRDLFALFVTYGVDAPFEYGKLTKAEQSVVLGAVARQHARWLTGSVGLKLTITRNAERFLKSR